MGICLEGLAFAAGGRGKGETALRLHFCAQNLLEQIDGHYEEPLTPNLWAAVERPQAEVGPQLTARLRAEGEALTTQEALRLAEAEG